MSLAPEGNVLKLTDKQLEQILRDTFVEFVEEVPKGLIERFIQSSVSKAQDINKRNMLFWSAEIKHLEREGGKMNENLLVR